MIHCRYATSLHTEAREGTLSGVRRRLYDLHMRVCPHCKAYAKGLEQTDAALKQLPEQKAPEELKRALAERLRTRR
ncbi:MAG: zf-HC2 domain-containing protein [Polyangiales bacterium]